MSDYMPERDPRDNIDDMGDDEQVDDIALAEEYVESPPPTVTEENEGSVGITDYERETSRRGSGPFPPPEEAAEEAALHEEDDRTT
ncbi:hypothetical protein [Actinomadura rudentiformis]|uniref:Uncharacterized protein n=1 Tax=Actinomadura rudentiformis TaxID=359158 RepID=A0A6H9YP22_9ACTN|nr:hypothetical protein [Actinomadura rudentiformis]KAB2341754.1 hypothetical protein F8566_39845 [Actinomadura rudentiformis]